MCIGVALLDTRMQFVRRYAGFKASQAGNADVDPMGVAVSQKMNSHMTPTEVLLCCRPGERHEVAQGGSQGRGKGWGQENEVGRKKGGGCRGCRGPGATKRLQGQGEGV